MDDLRTHCDVAVEQGGANTVRSNLIIQILKLKTIYCSLEDISDPPSPALRSYCISSILGFEAGSFIWRSFCEHTDPGLISAVDA